MTSQEKAALLQAVQAWISANANVTNVQQQAKTALAQAQAAESVARNAVVAQMEALGVDKVWGLDKVLWRAGVELALYDAPSIV